MPINTDGNLQIYCLNVGQGDTTIILTPKNHVILIDAVNPRKITALLNQLGLSNGDTIQHIVVTHPHNDHYSAVEPLLNIFDVREVTLTSLRKYKENKPGYIGIINLALRKGIPTSFLSGYRVVFPDGSPFEESSSMKLELLGPSNQFVEDLSQSKDLGINHYSILARIEIGKSRKFRMIVSGDAQMENWAHFDREQMLNASCTVLRSAHHGSANGTQYERFGRLRPKVVIVSSDPDGKDKLPDLIGCATMLRYASESSNPLVALTRDTGTILIRVTPSGSRRLFCYRDEAKDNVDLAKREALKHDTNPTRWDELLKTKIP